MKFPLGKTLPTHRPFAIANNSDSATANSSRSFGSDSTNPIARTPMLQCDRQTMDVFPRLLEKHNLDDILFLSQFTPV